MPRDLPPMTTAQRADATARRPTAAHLLLDVLLDGGVAVAFGVPGGAISAVYDACADRPALRVVTTRHESAAVFAALGWARLTGRPAAVFVTSGPGFTNALTGIAAAHCEGLPVVVIAGEVTTASVGRFALQDGTSHGLDVMSMARPITRLAARVAAASGIDGVAHAALRAACGESPGPVLLSLPLDIARARATPQPFYAAPWPTPRPVLTAACERAAQLLASSRRSLLVLGAGARAVGAGRVAVALAERAGAMAAVTAHAKGAFPEEHPRYLGVLGFAGHAEAHAYAQTADVVLVVGSRLGDLTTHGWSVALAPSGALIHVDRAPEAIGRSYPATLAIVADAEEALDGIFHALPAPPPGAEPPRLRAVAGGPPYPVPVASPACLRPEHLLRALQAVLPRETIYAVDVGEHAAFAVHHLRIDAAHRFHAFTGLGSMGSGLCAAMGLKLAAPTAPVVAIVGDGGFMMHAGEVLSCVEAGVPVVFVVLNDGRFGMVDAGVAEMYGRRCPGLPCLVANLADVACACGAVGITITHVDELTPQLAATLSTTTRPVVLDVRVEAGSRLSVASRTATLAHYSSPGPT